jgi:hypothetical protein
MGALYSGKKSIYTVRKDAVTTPFNTIIGRVIQDLDPSGILATLFSRTDRFKAGFGMAGLI